MSAMHQIEEAIRTLTDLRHIQTYDVTIILNRIEETILMNGNTIGLKEQ